MPSPLERTAVALSQLRHCGGGIGLRIDGRNALLGLLAGAMALLLLSTSGFGTKPEGATVPGGPAAGGSAASATAGLNARPIAGLVALPTAAPVGADWGAARIDEWAPVAEGEPALLEVEESQEEVGESPATPDFGWLAWVRETRTPRRPDPIVELRRGQLAPTRAPPAAAVTLG